MPSTDVLPKGFLSEVARRLVDGSAEQVSNVTLQVCIERGLLDTDIDAADERRADELERVFQILGEVTAAVSDGSVVPSGRRLEEEIDPTMAAIWSPSTT